MAASLCIEQESGTYTARFRHPHNGYYAGDFSDVPPATESQLAALTSLRRDPAQPQPHH
jgi:hypothetical protein